MYSLDLLKCSILPISRMKDILFYKKKKTKNWSQHEKSGSTKSLSMNGATAVVVCVMKIN